MLPDPLSRFRLAPPPPRYNRGMETLNLVCPWVLREITCEEFASRPVGWLVSALGELGVDDGDVDGCIPDGAA